MSLAVFESLLLGSFALFTLAAGLFTAYFGAGKSRRIGFGLVIVGLLAGFVFVALTFSIFPEIAESPWTGNDLLVGLAGVAGAALGGLLALLLFLASIVRA
ncbi:MAG: hypothetical protein ACRETX_17385 [Steroidobacteraceae bacterium]